MLPFWLERSRAGTNRLRLLGAGTSTGTEPLAAPGREEEVAVLAVPALAATTPRADAVLLEGVPGASPWPRLLAHAWPGARPGLLHRRSSSPEPWVDLTAGSFDAWVAGRSASFRGQLRKVRRRLADRGVTARRARTVEEAERAVSAFLELHHGRWRERGGSAVVTPAVERMLRDAGPGLAVSGQLDLWTLDADGRAVCAQINHVAGDRVAMWLGGFDPAWADARLTLACFAAVVEDGFARRLDRVSLGEGGQDYKLRFADGTDTLDWTVLPLPGPRLPAVLAGLQARRAVRAARRRLTRRAAA